MRSALAVSCARAAGLLGLLGLLACSTAARGSGAGAPTSAGAAARTVLYDFASGDAAGLEEQDPFGTITLGAADPGAHDGRAAKLLFKGGTAAVGPARNAAEIETVARFGFGEYRFRARLATCQPSEELVNGLFLYRNDGLDHDGDGLVDNEEIDIEILCAQPSFINLTSWTEYSDDAHMRKKSRVVDLDTGTIYVGVTDGYGVDRGDRLTGTVDPKLRHPGWYDPTAYYEMGWDREPDHVRWFIELGGAEVTLWDLRDVTRLPRDPATMRFNLWHPRWHWNEGGAPTPARNDAVLSLDWFSFTSGA